MAVLIEWTTAEATEETLAGRPCLLLWAAAYRADSMAILRCIEVICRTCIGRCCVCLEDGCCLCRLFCLRGTAPQPDNPTPDLGGNAARQQHVHRSLAYPRRKTFGTHSLVKKRLYLVLPRLPQGGEGQHSSTRLYGMQDLPGYYSMCTVQA